MHYVQLAELSHARWKSRRLLAVVFLSFGVGETKCSQGNLLQYAYHNSIIENGGHRARAKLKLRVF